MANEFLDKTGLTSLWSKITTKLSGKVDKITGKGLSTNDYTNSDASKVASLSTASTKGVDTSIAAASSSENLPTSKAVAAFVEGKGYISTSLKGAASGVAELDENGKVPTSQLPSFVDDVVEYSSSSNFPLEGEAGKIYVDTLDNKTYRWSGSSYVEISPSLALGETSATAYRGDRGKTAYGHASAKGSAFSSGLYKITTNSEGHVTGATAVTKSDITALGIPGSDTNTNTTYTLTQDSSDGHKLTFTGSDGTSKTFTIPDKDTTYTLNALAFLGTNPTGGVANDTQAFWKSKGTGYALFNATNQLNDQPFQSGFLINLVYGNEVHQEFWVQSNGAHYHRGANSNTTAMPSWMANNTTYSNLAAASGGTDVSLVTTGEKATWNAKTSNTGTVTKVSTGAGLTGGDVTTTGTVKANLTSDDKLTNAAADGTETAGRVYPVRLDKNGKLAVNVPWSNTTVATAIKDIGSQNRNITIRYGGDGADATNWIPMYDNDGNLVPVSSADLANKVKGELNALAFLGTNPTGGTANDTRENWTNLGTGYAYFNKTGQLNGQPFQSGFLINLVRGSEVHQEFWVQSNGAHYHRGGNGNTTAMPSWKPNDTTYSNATTSTAGLMSAADKAKLDNMQSQIDQWKSYTQALRSAMQDYIDNLPEAPDDMN